MPLGSPKRPEPDEGLVGRAALNGHNGRSVLVAPPTMDRVGPRKGWAVGGAFRVGVAFVRRGALGLQVRVPVARVALLGAALLAGSAASAQAASPSHVQRKAYSILLRATGAQLAVSRGDVTRNATAVEQQVAPCLQRLQTPMSSTVALALGKELGAQYTAQSLRPLLQTLITTDKQTETLPIRQAVKAELATQVTLATGVLALNICADYTAWSAAGFAPSGEPAGMRLAAAYANAPQASAEDVLYFMLTADQERAIHPVWNKAIAHGTDLLNTMKASFAAWVVQTGL